MTILGRMPQEVRSSSHMILRSAAVTDSGQPNLPTSRSDRAGVQATKARTLSITGRPVPARLRRRSCDALAGQSRGLPERRWRRLMFSIHPGGAPSRGGDALACRLASHGGGEEATAVAPNRQRRCGHHPERWSAIRATACSGSRQFRQPLTSCCALGWRVRSTTRRIA